jgi:glyceraldehyde 3-phosphate dehydrogenase
MADALNNLLPIKKGFMTTVHAYTHEQNIVDAPHARGNLRRARAAAMNISPTTTGAAKAIGLVIPSLSGKLDGSSLRVPVSAGSIVELFAIVGGKITADEINAAMKRASSESFGYTDDEIVSSDVVGMRYGSLFDATLTKVMEAGDETLVKVSAWYDNENSFVSQMTRTIRYMARLR